MNALIDILGNSLSHEAFVQNIDDRRPLARLDRKHLANGVSQRLAVHLVDRRVGSSEDFDSQAIDGLGVEGVPQVAHLVEDAAEGPHVGLITVWLVFEQFWRHVVGRTNARVGEIFGAVEDLGNTKITKSDLNVKQRLDDYNITRELTFPFLRKMFYVFMSL